MQAGQLPKNADKTSEPQVDQVLAEAQAALDRGDVTAALAMLEHARSANDADVLIALGNLQYQLGKFAASFDALQIATTLRPDDPLVRVLLATAAVKCERMPEFEAAVSRALQLDSSFAPAHRLLADLNLEAGRYADAARHYGVLFNQNQNDIPVLLALGKCLAELKNLPAAEECFAHVLNLDRHNQLARENLSVLRNRRDESQFAARIPDQAKTGSPPEIIVSKSVSDPLVAASESADYDILFSFSTFKSAPLALRMLQTLNRIQGRHLAVCVSPSKEDLEFLREHRNTFSTDTLLIHSAIDNQSFGRAWGFVLAAARGVRARYFCTCDDDLEFTANSADMLQRLDRAAANPGFSLMAFLGTHPFKYPDFDSELGSLRVGAPWLDGNCLFSRFEDNLKFGVNDAPFDEPAVFYTEVEYYHRLQHFTGKPGIVDAEKEFYIHHFRAAPEMQAARSDRHVRREFAGRDFWRRKFGFEGVKFEGNADHQKLFRDSVSPENAGRFCQHLLFEGRWNNWTEIYNRFAPELTILDSKIQSERVAKLLGVAGSDSPQGNSQSGFLKELEARNIWRSGQPLKLHLGCGEQHFDGYVNVDYPPSEHTCQTRIGADMFADITKLAVPPQSVDEIRLHHVFEHFKRAEALALLIRWHEMLKIGGRLHLETPDLEGCARQIVSNIPFRMKQAVVRHCFGSQEAGWACHYDGWTEQRFQHVLGQFGFNVQTRASAWPHPPHLANVEAVATKARALSRDQLLAAADQFLSEYTVADVPSEQGMCEVWRKAMRVFLAATEPAPVTPVIGVIFSKDRPLQLDGTLRSFFARCQDANQCRLKVLYRASAEFQPHYDTLAKDYPTVEFVSEKDFRGDLLNILSGAEFVMFVVDDNLFVRDFTLAEVTGVLRQQPAAIGFSLRLGHNTTFCYPINKSQSLPLFEAVAPRIVKFDWTKADGDFSYPLEVSSSVYRLADVLPLLNEKHFKNPNTLESELANCAARLSGKPKLLCFEKSRAFCNPINMVQTLFKNRVGEASDHSPEQLARSFSAGNRLNIEAYKDFTPTGCHQEAPLHLIQAASDAPIVSVVINCHNYANHLAEAVASVRNQTCRNFEIILVDDGSTDESPAIAQKLAAEMNPEIPFRVFRLNDVGPSAARRFAVSQARGKYYLPLDADDRIAPEFLAKTVPVLEANDKLGFAYVDTVYFGDEQHRHHQPEYDFARLCQANFISHTSLIRKTAFDSVGGYDSENWGYYEDWDLWIRLGSKGWFGKHVAEPLFFYRHHFNSSLSLFARRLDPIYNAFVRSRHPQFYSETTVAEARRILAEMPVGWNLRPPMRNLDQLKSLLAQHPQNRHVLYFLACALIKKGERVEAETVLKNLLAMHPNDTQAREALAGAMELIRGARPPRAQFDAPRVEHFAVRATKPNSSSNVAARLADETSARTREGARAPQFQLNGSGLTQMNATPTPTTQIGKTPLVSVIVPTYNRPDWLGETLKSILAQTYRDFEIIVVNDAGPDVSRIVEPLNGDGCIRLITHEKNKGLAGARNTGIRAARGKYIAYLDDDDIYHPNHLQTLVEHLETTGGEVAYTDAYRAHQRKNGDAYEIFKRDVPYSFDFDCNRILWENFVPVLCVMHRKSCWETVGGFDESLRVLEDWDIWIRMSRVFKFAHIPTVTCEFRWRTDSSSMTAADHAKFQTTTRTILDKHRTERPEIDEPCDASEAVPAQAEFGETSYLSVNRDVADAVREGRIASGWHHFVTSGRAEGRRWFRKRVLADVPQPAAKIARHLEELNPANCDYDVLIPIYNAPDDVRRCVESLLRNTELRHTIYLLDDASPDKRIAPMLAEFAARHSHIKVVTADKNGGFVANMNRGFALSRRDVIILNSDTEVTPGWLDRMDRCRRSDSAIGIVCPVSNNATILSVPRMNARNVLPQGMTPDVFAALVARHSERLYPQIPTAIGFCMLITRETLDTAGVFDLAFGLGYGEENDLCLRAWAAGKQSVCCDDAFVQHYGEASFGQVAGIGERRRRNAELLERRWPHYSTSVYRYCQSNPLRKLQEQLRVAIAGSNDQRPHVLQVIHNYNAPGGTELHTQEIVERISNRYRQTVTFPGNIGEWSDFSEATSPSGTRVAILNRINAAPTHLYLGFQPGDVRNATVEENFRQFVAGGDYGLIHFQHLAGWASLHLPRIAKELGKRCVISLHDYFLQCPEYVLLNEAGERCNKVRADAGDADCLRCLTAKRMGLTRELPPIPQYLQLRKNLSRDALEQMDAIIAPSEFVRRRILDAFGNDLAARVRVIPHGVNTLPRRPRRKVSSPLRVGVLGTLNYQKGLKQVAEAAALLKDAPLRLEVFGAVPPAVGNQLTRLGIKEHGGYNRKQLPELLRDVDLILIPSLFDETFCLTLSEAQALGIPVLASAVGAITERVVDGETGFLFAPATGQALAARLRELCQQPDSIQAVGERVREIQIKTLDQNAEDYAELYGQVLAAPAQRTEPRPDSSTLVPVSATWRNTLTQKPDGNSLTSIIILTWNQFEHTQRCVESIAAHTPERHEIIFVDNGSTDGTVAWLRDYAKNHEHVRLIENKSNRGFAGGNNQGLAIAKGDFILLLNNDTIVTPGWLGRMLAAAANPQVGIVGPMSNCVSGPQLVPEVPYRHIETLSAFATPWAVEHTKQIQIVGRIVGFCLLMRRAVLEAVGGLDERYGSGNFEDDDFCVRVRLAGFAAAIARDAFVHHAGGQTFKGARINYNEAMRRNWDLFRAKWQLPGDASLERGYRFPTALPEGVALRSPLASLEKTHETDDGRCWLESIPVANAKVFKTPSVAQIGTLDAARAQFGRKEYSAAWEETTAAMAKRPFHPEGFLLLAEIALAAGDANTARVCARRARDFAPEWNKPKQLLKNAEGEKRKAENESFAALMAKDASRLTQHATRISVCLIVKNEEKFLAQCLASVRYLAHQLIVVDTGSTDRTIEIAKEHGAEVHTFAWCDDFSAARNVALEHATGDWVLMLDADEELSADQHGHLLADLKKPGVIAHRLPLVNRGQEADGRSFVPRLFRNAPGVFYHGRIHEQVFPSLVGLGKTWGLGTALGTAQIVHHGYSKEMVNDRNKIERNLALLRKAIEDDPADANLVMNLGLELVRSGNLREGIAKYREAFSLMSAQPANEVVPELREVLLSQFTSHLYKIREHEQVVRVLTSPLANNGGLTATLHFALGLSSFELKNYREAVEQMRQCLAKRNQPALSPINTDIHGVAPRHCMALSLAKLGDHDGAEKAFQAAIAESGSTELLRLDHAKFLAQQNRQVDALHKLHELVAQNSGNSAAWKLGAEIALNQAELLEFGCDWTGEAVKYLATDIGIIAQRAEALMLNGDPASAIELWEKLWRSEPGPRTLAALVLCAITSGESSRIPEVSAEQAVSRAFVEWYQKLLAMRAQPLIEKVNEQLETLSRTLPGAARILESALSEAAVPA